MVESIQKYTRYPADNDYHDNFNDDDYEELILIPRDMFKIDPITPPFTQPIPSGMRIVPHKVQPTKPIPTCTTNNMPFLLVMMKMIIMEMVN